MILLIFIDKIQSDFKIILLIDNYLSLLDKITIHLKRYILRKNIYINLQYKWTYPTKKLTMSPARPPQYLRAGLYGKWTSESVNSSSDLIWVSVVAPCNDILGSDWKHIEWMLNWFIQSVNKESCILTWHRRWKLKDQGYFQIAAKNGSRVGLKKAF